MHKNYNMQNEKIARLGVNTLIGGIDIAKDIHEVKWITRGSVTVGKMRFKNRREDFEKLICQMNELKEETGAEKVIIAMEPTGVYGFALQWYLEQLGIEVIIVNGREVHNAGRIMNNDSSKNDGRDAMIIGQLTNFGCYSRITREKEGAYAELRELTQRRETLAKDNTRFANRLHKELAMLFPEYGEFKRNGISAAVRALFKEYGTLENMKKVTAPEIHTVWRKYKANYYDQKAAVEMYNTIQNSVGIKRNITTTAYTIREEIEDYERNLKKREEIDQLIEKRLEHMPQAQQLMAIDGIGPVITAGLLAEIGDIHKYRSPKQIQKLAGYAPVTNSSGKHKGKTKCSKMGRMALKKTLYMAGRCLIRTNEGFKKIYSYYTEERKTPLVKMKGIIAIACKLIRVIYAILKNGTAYDEEKMLMDRKPEMMMSV